MNGLAMVLAAYARGMDMGGQQGPKHAMKFVNKNPLQDVIANAAESMGNEDWYIKLRDACVELVTSVAGDTAAYNWTGKSLTVIDWADHMKKSNVDLVAKYDTAYRSSQIGGLSSLNEVLGPDGKVNNKVPIIEFRDLGDKKPSEMREVFESIINKLGE